MDIEAIKPEKLTQFDFDPQFENVIANNNENLPPCYNRIADDHRILNY